MTYRAGRWEERLGMSKRNGSSHEGKLPEVDHSCFRWTADLICGAFGYTQERVGSNWEARPSKPGWWVVVTNAEREVSEDEVFYSEAATNVPDKGILLQRCDGSQRLGLVAAK